VVLQNPEAVRAIITTEPAGKEEAAALRAVRDQLANCVTEGQTLALNKANLRALLSVSLYRVLSEQPLQAQ
jgi:regulator of replication initiation timing